MTFSRSTDFFALFSADVDRSEGDGVGAADTAGTGKGSGCH